MEKISTGFNQLDKNLWLYKGNLVVVGARPAIGKTSFMCSIMENTKSKYKSLFFTMETKKSIRIDHFIGRALDFSENVSIERKIVDFEELLMTVAECKVKSGLDVVYINNFSDLIACSNHTEKELVVKLKELAKRLNVLVIVASPVINFDRKYINYKDICHKQFIKYADKIIIIDRPDRMATYKQLIKGLIVPNEAIIRVDKDVDTYFYTEIKFKFDTTSLRFSETPKSS